jgi:Leucine-rich repeat (LRR) protein
MARLYDAIEPEVVSMNMLQHAVESLRADGENNLIPKEDKLDYSEVDSLRLDFRSKFNLTIYRMVVFFSVDILRMENLWLFSNLTKLQMDNNIIERIEGLDTLQKLTWLGEIFSKFKSIFFEFFI